MNNNRYEQGGVVTFLIVAVVLGALLVSGILLVKQHAKNAEGSPQSVAVNQKQSDKNSDERTNTNNSNDSSDSEDNKSASGQTKEENRGTQPNNPQNQLSGESGQRQTGGNTPTSPGPSNQSPTSSTTLPNSGPSEVSELPSTGPTENILAVVVLAALGGGIYGYIRSRRLLEKSALN